MSIILILLQKSKTFYTTSKFKIFIYIYQCIGLSIHETSQHPPLPYPHSVQLKTRLAIDEDLGLVASCHLKPGSWPLPRQTDLPSDLRGHRILRVAWTSGSSSMSCSPCRKLKYLQCAVLACRLCRYLAREASREQIYWRRHLGASVCGTTAGKTLLQYILATRLYV